MKFICPSPFPACLCFSLVVLLNEGLGGLSLLGEPGLQPMNAALNISNRTYAHLKEIHKRWRDEWRTGDRKIKRNKKINCNAQ